MTIDASLASKVADASIALAAAGQSDLVWGHVALRSPDGLGILVKRSGIGFEEVTPADIQLLSWTGQILEGSGSRHIEYAIHVGILQARPDVQAVVHTHSRSATAFASLDVPLRPLSHDAAPFLDPDIPRFNQSGDLISTREVADALAVTLGSANGCLIPGHGCVTVGVSLAAAVMRASLLDRACQIHLDAAAAGGSLRWSSDDEVASKRDVMWNDIQLGAGYEYLVRQARRSVSGG